MSGNKPGITPSIADCRLVRCVAWMSVRRRGSYSPSAWASPTCLRRAHTGLNRCAPREENGIRVCRGGCMLVGALNGLLA